VLSRRPFVCDGRAPAAHLHAWKQEDSMPAYEEERPLESDVSILGLGAMGAALAMTTLRGGRKVTVWNRSPERAAPLARGGAGVAPSAAAAVRAAPIVIVCVTGYEAMYEALADADLGGRVLVQLSTGTPSDARAGARWAAARGADYLDGAILAVPTQMGTPESTILVSGSETAFARSKPLLAVMAGTVSYVGVAPFAAATLDLAFLAHLFPGLVGFYHAARICEVEGLGVESLGAMLLGVAPAIGAMVKHDADRIARDDYARPENTVDICAAALELLVRQAREAGIDESVVAFTASVFERARRAGLGSEAPAAVVKVLRATSVEGGAR